MLLNTIALLPLGTKCAKHYISYHSILNIKKFNIALKFFYFNMKKNDNNI